MYISLWQRLLKAYLYFSVNIFAQRLVSFSFYVTHNTVFSKSLNICGTDGNLFLLLVRFYVRILTVIFSCVIMPSNLF